MLGWLRFFFFSSRRRHTRLVSDWSSDVCSSDLPRRAAVRGTTNPALRLLPGVALLMAVAGGAAGRSEERRVGKEGRSRRVPDRQKRNTTPNEDAQKHINTRKTRRHHST